MLRLSIIFLGLAIVAGVLGLASISDAAIGVAKILFVFFAVLFFVAAFASGAIRRSLRNK